MIKSLYKGPNNERYFQKSRVFLYPVLETKRNTQIKSIVPISSYISWEGHYSPEDMKLICSFYLRNDEGFKLFEKNMLLRHPQFFDFKECEDGIGVYIFDFSKFSLDWNFFLMGKYSKMGPVVKERIKNYYNANNSNAVWVDSFINPNKYYEIYSRLLNVEVSTLKGGELCDCPDFTREHLNLLVKEEGVTDKSVDLPNSKTNNND